MAGPKSNYITKQDMKIIEQAFQHRIDQYNQHIDQYGPLCTDADILAPTDRITDSFIAQSRHYLPDVLDRQDCSSLHRSEYSNLKDDLDYCRGEERRRYSDDSDEETELPWRRYWLSFGDDPPCSHPRILLARFVCLYDFLEMMPCHLAVTIRKMYPHLRLPYIVSLLVNYHYGGECKAYMSVAIKLCLKALQLSLYSLKRRPYAVAHNLRYYCKLIHRYRLDDELVAIAFRVFHVKAKVNFVFLKEVLSLKYVLRALQKSGLKTSLLNEVKLGVLRTVDRCLFFLDEKYVQLVEFGAISHYSEKDCRWTEELNAPKSGELCPLDRSKRNQGNNSPSSKSRHSHKDTESQKSSHHSSGEGHEKRKRRRRKRDLEEGFESLEVVEERSKATCVVVAISSTIILLAVSLVIVTLYLTPHFDDFERGYYCCNNTVDPHNNPPKH
ncbi:uncharacterized protein [Parasteatoda tepidariorum]|uniref:uncharacterized protein isoform X2 n=1 Tax=Parasteatoda tepidariorum TaxID=114398 RepID=UPI0039BC7748